MDLAQIQSLTDGQKARFAKFERLFNEPGWGLVVEHAKLRAEEAAQRVLSAPNWDTTLINRGARAVYIEIANLQESLEQEFSALAEANAERQMTDDEVKFE